MGIDLLALHDSLASAGIPVVGVTYCTHEVQDASLVSAPPVSWIDVGSGSVRIDLSRDMTAEEQAQAEGLVSSWAEA